MVSRAWVVAAGFVILGVVAFLTARTPVQVAINAAVLSAIYVAVLLAIKSFRGLNGPHREAERARQSFRLGREMLEAKFFTLASSLGKPRDVRWLDCQWHDDVVFARDRQTGMITAFVSVSLSFEAIEGGDMEEVEAVGKLRDACALFHYQQGQWGTGGRALFNMDPQSAAARFQDQYELLNLPAAPSTVQPGTTGGIK